jgi:hypothetical protein
MVLEMRIWVKAATQFPGYDVQYLKRLLRKDRQKEQAVGIYALASRFFEDVVGRHITAVAATLPPAVVAAALERPRASTIQ